MGLGYDKGELTRSWEIEAARTRDEDRRDYERELAGIDIGRDARFHGTEFVEDRRQGRSSASSSQRSAQHRENQRLTVMALLSSQHLRERLGNLYEGLDDTRGKGRDISGRLAELDEKLNRWRDTIYGNAATLDGKAIFARKDGRVIDEDGNDVPAARVAGVDFKGKTTAEEKEVYDATRSEVDGLKEGLSNAMGDLDALEDGLNRRIAENPDDAAEIMDEAERAHKGIDRQIDEIGERAQEMQRGFEASTPNTDARRDVKVEHPAVATATMAMPQLP